MSITPCTSSRRSVVLPLDVAHAREVEQLLGDLLAAEGFVLNHPQVAADDVTSSARSASPSSSSSCSRPSSDSLHMAIEASGLLISWATPAARKPTLASCSLRTTCLVRSLHLAVEVVANLLEAGGHVVHRLGQLGHFVARIEVDAMVEIAGRHLARALDQHAQRPEDPLVEQPHEAGHHHQGGHGAGPGQRNERAPLIAHIVGEVVDVAVQIAR